MWQVTGDRGQVRGAILHLTHGVGWTFLYNFSSQVRVMMFWVFGGKRSMTDSINEWQSCLYNSHGYTGCVTKFQYRHFSPNQPTGPIRSSSLVVAMFVSCYLLLLLLSPFHAILPGEQRRSQGRKVASYWPSDHMIRYRRLRFSRLHLWKVHTSKMFDWWTGAFVDQLIQP